MRYILITPTKDEEKNLPLLAESILQQTILPKIWVIADESVDDTPKIIENLKEEFDWIRSKTMERSTDYLGSSFSRAVKDGFEYAMNICEKENIDYEFIGKADADAILPKDYFERLIEKFQQDMQLGVAGGGEYLVKLTNQKSYEEINESERIYTFPDYVCDWGRLYRKECLKDIGNIPVSNTAQDTVLLVKARLKGWKTFQFKEIKAYITRNMSSKEGVWKGAKIDAYKLYYLDYQPFLVILATLRSLLKKPYYRAFILFYSYCLNVLKREEKINDQEVRDYFRHKRLAEIIEFILQKVRIKKC